MTHRVLPMRSRRRLELDLVNETPAPVLAGFEAAHHGMVRMMEVFRCMLLGRIVATANVSAKEAKPQMHPASAIFQAFLASGGSTGLHVMDLIKMRTRW
jgi:hypothetical protein